MNNDKAIALLRRMQEPEAYEPQITAEAFEALGMAIRAIRMTEVLAGELDGCPLPDPCYKLFGTGWCKDHCKSQEATAACWLKYAEVVVDDHIAEVSKKAIPPDVPDTNVGDTISRQAAIDALCDEYCDGWQDCKYYPKCENLKAIQNLPSAQPEIIHCRECKFASGDSRICMKSGYSPIGELDFCAWAERRTDE